MNIQQKIFTNRVLICALIGWSEEQYAQHQYQSGLDFIKYYLPFDEQAQRVLEGNKMFWCWWRNRWALRDEGILICNLSNETTEVKLAMYLDVHSNTIKYLHPHRVITNILFKKSKTTIL